MVGNKDLAALTDTIRDAIETYTEGGRVSYAELIGVLEMLKLDYFDEFRGVIDDMEEDDDDPSEVT